MVKKDIVITHKIEGGNRFCIGKYLDISRFRVSGRHQLQRTAATGEGRQEGFN